MTDPKPTGTQWGPPHAARSRRAARLAAGLLWLAAAAWLAACVPAETKASLTPTASADPGFQALILAERDPEIPDLPFPDNPDPSLCGIPTRWGTPAQAWLTGYFAGELVQPVVLLYDSHLRLDITAQAPHGTEVTILLYQENPVTDYYLVKITGGEDPGGEGWVPEHFLSFEPVE